MDCAWAMLEFKNGILWQYSGKQSEKNPKGWVKLSRPKSQPLISDDPPRIKP